MTSTQLQKSYSFAPLRHTPSFFGLETHERNACLSLVDEMRQMILKKDKTVTGFNIDINDGIDAGQTVFHSHIHIIPRRKGDVSSPRSGIRNIIPDKNSY
jgi:diadenosine tetraphosphate (Ap4A) HIT family hydrolase